RIGKVVELPALPPPAVPAGDGVGTQCQESILTLARDIVNEDSLGNNLWPPEIERPRESWCRTEAAAERRDGRQLRVMPVHWPIATGLGLFLSWRLRKYASPHSHEHEGYCPEEPQQPDNP